MGAPAPFCGKTEVFPLKMINEEQITRLRLLFYPWIFKYIHEISQNINGLVPKYA